MKPNDRKVLALLIEANASRAVSALRGDDVKGVSPLQALAAGRVLEQTLGDAIHALAGEARSTGHTWQEIADVASTTRQAAFQRFGRPRDQIRPARHDPLKAKKRALAFVQDFMTGCWDEVRLAFDDAARAHFQDDHLERVRRQLLADLGPLDSCSDAAVCTGLGLSVVDVHVHCERASKVARISFNRALRVNGFFMLPTREGQS